MDVNPVAKLISKVFYKLSIAPNNLLSEILDVENIIIKHTLISKVCSVFEVANILNSILKNSDNEYRTRYICSQCFNKYGGHLYEHMGRGKNHRFSCKEKHTNDEELEKMNLWKT
ncbi:7174_t:CDS:1, partial [Gigaspora rosea]